MADEVSCGVSHRDIDVVNGLRDRLENKSRVSNKKKRSLFEIFKGKCR